MQGPPPLSLSLEPGPAWRAGVGVLVALAVAALAAWAPGAYGALPMPLWGGLLAAAALAIAAAWRLRGLPAVQLHWDGWQWQCAVDGLPWRPGTVSVALDVGGWMLLAFRADAAPAPASMARRRWIPVHRRGAGVHWHAMRCAVYSPRPAPGRSPAAASPTPSE